MLSLLILRSREKSGYVSLTFVYVAFCFAHIIVRIASQYFNLHFVTGFF